MRHYSPEALEPAIRPLEASPAVPSGQAAKLCAVCSLPLEAGDRKVHQGRCQRVRKTQLQRQVRRLRRR